MLSKLRDFKKSKYLKSPWIESIIMGVSVIVGYFCLAVLSIPSRESTTGDARKSIFIFSLLARTNYNFGASLMTLLAAIDNK